MKEANLNEGFVKALFYGAPGSTKTRTAASAVFVPELSPVLMLESAGNPLSIRDYEVLPTIFTMDKMKDYNYPYDWLLNGQPAKHPFTEMCEKAGIDLPNKPFKSVFVDGMSEVQRFAFRTIVPGRDASPGDVPTAVEIQHFNAVLAMMVNWAYKYIKLPMHVMLSSLEAEKQSGTAGAIYRRPLLWGQSQGEVASYVYLVMRLTTSEYLDSRTKSVVASDLAEVSSSDFIGFTRQSASFYAKDQYGMKDKDGKLMRYMFDPTMQKIWDAIGGNL